jgi:hypothetical protein
MLKYLVSASTFGLLLALAPGVPVLAQTGGGSMPTCKANDPVVWLTPRNSYHLKGDGAYGRSPNGRYECLSTAKTHGAARGPVAPMGAGGGTMGAGNGGMMGAGGGMMGAGGGMMGPGGMMGTGPGTVARPSPPACKAGDPVVWLTPRNFYFTKADFQYTRARYGRYLCESQAKTQGAVRGPPAGSGMMRGGPPNATAPVATPK